ncbi:MAG: methyltransferase domain-containing protein, partial [candidate division Zixibacteria bacterium]|nr:methyltransferase domain-containing protein [candidate division Zixibacteria bacterium]
MSQISRQALLEEINKHEWYQRISLGDGVVTPGETDDTSEKKLTMMNLPDSLVGKSVLDIGCNEGFFAFEAERRGAAPILAIDASNRAEKKFELVKRALNSMIKFERKDLMDISPEKHGTFELVFFLAVYHHVRHPFAVIDHL